MVQIQKKCKVVESLFLIRFIKKYDTTSKNPLHNTQHNHALLRQRRLSFYLWESLHKKNHP